MFQKVLVANRGEIACRVIRALRERGIKSVAIYSEADQDTRHRRLADEAYPIGAAPVAQSYLRQEAIIELACEIGAEAIHPGYGLLSENAAFARRCREAGVVFIGPAPEVIEQMGDKARARSIAVDAGVPVVPGSPAPLANLEEAATVAEEIGYPVLLKAAAGGGGIGMRLVKKASQLEKHFTACKSLAERSFGDGTLYLEKYVSDPRHLEVQILGDQHGHIVHLFERECSVQRRHQKVVEEAPAPLVGRRPELREAICDAALKLARAVSYDSAGTVEFIANEAGELYFIEMNTRLQVEHPVTELVTGIDIVQAQLSIAAGEPLSFTQSEVELKGAAIEWRVCAEDPAKKLAPSPGPLDRFQTPEGEGIRVDSGFDEGQRVSPYYDSLLAKLVCSGPNRNTAIERSVDGLKHFLIEGIASNLPLLREVAEHETFLGGSYDTKWLERLLKERVS